MFLRGPSMNPTTQNIPKNHINSKYKETEKEREPERGKPKPIKASKLEHEFQRSIFFYFSRTRSRRSSLTPKTWFTDWGTQTHICGSLSGLGNETKGWGTLRNDNWMLIRSIHPLIHRVITKIPNMPLDILAEPLNPRGKIIQLEIQASDDNELFMTLLCIDASFAMRPRATPKSKPNSIPGFEAQNHKPSSGGFEAQISKPSWRLVSATPPPWYRRVSLSVLEHPITKSSSAFTWLGQPPSWPGQHCQLRTPHVHLLVEPPTASLPVLGPSVQASRPSFTAPSPLARHEPAWPSP